MPVAPSTIRAPHESHRGAPRDFRPGAFAGGHSHSADRRCRDQDPGHVGRTTVWFVCGHRWKWWQGTRQRSSRRRDFLSHARATEPVCAGLRQNPGRPQRRYRCATPWCTTSSTSTIYGPWTGVALHRTNSVPPTRASINTLSSCAAGPSTWIRRGAGSGVRPVGCVPRPGGQWHRAGRHGGLAGRRHRSRAARGRRSWPSRAGHPLPPLAAGSRTSIPSSFQPSTAAAVGGRWCTSAACSSFATVRWRGNGPPVQTSRGIARNAVSPPREPRTTPPSYPQGIAGTPSVRNKPGAHGLRFVD